MAKAAVVASKTNPKPRLRKQRSYKSFQLSKKIKISQKQKIAKAWIIFWESLKFLRKNWKSLLGISLVYGVLALILVRGFSGSLSMENVKSSVQDSVGGTFPQLAGGLVLFGALLGSFGSNASDISGVYQSILLVITSLAFIWGLRQLHAKQKITIKDSFYKGMFPLIPFTAVLFVIILQLLPMTIGGWLFTTVTSNGLAVSGGEQFAWGALFFLLTLLSLYMICSSVFALYIVTLPDMTPMRALRSAKQLVVYRRWLVIRKILFLPLVLLLAAFVIFLPLLVWATFLAEPVFFILTAASLAIIHTYMYELYRKLI